MKDIKDIQKELFGLSDGTYRIFQSRLVPSVSPQRIIGVRIPVLRKYAGELARSGDFGAFLEVLPHEYYDEDNLHAFLIEKIRDFDLALSETERFLPYIDNWATCDMFMPRVFGKNKEKLISHVIKWINSKEAYTVRYGIGILMRLYLDGDFKDEYASLAASVRFEEYYVKMMQAWYFATALAKQHDAVIGYITEKRLDPWVHNKTIQKAAESYRIPPEVKKSLKALKI